MSEMPDPVFRNQPSPGPPRPLDSKTCCKASKASKASKACILELLRLLRLLKLLRLVRLVRLLRFLRLLRLLRLLRFGDVGGCGFGVLRKGRGVFVEISLPPDPQDL